MLSWSVHDLVYPQHQFNLQIIGSSNHGPTNGIVSVKYIIVLHSMSATQISAMLVKIYRLN